MDKWALILDEPSNGTAIESIWRTDTEAIRALFDSVQRSKRPAPDPDEFGPDGLYHDPFEDLVRWTYEADGYTWTIQQLPEYYFE